MGHMQLTCICSVAAASVASTYDVDVLAPGNTSRLSLMLHFYNAHEHSSSATNNWCSRLGSICMPCLGSTCLLFALLIRPCVQEFIDLMCGLYCFWLQYLDHHGVEYMILPLPTCEENKTFDLVFQIADAIETFKINR